MTPAQMVYSLSPERLRELQSTLLEAGMAYELGTDYRKIFKKHKTSSSGKLKKLYTALSQANKTQMDNICSIILNYKAKK